MRTHDPEQALAIVAGVRTPFCRAGGALKDLSAGDLATHVFREVLDRTGIDPAEIDEVILGCAGAGSNESNVARVAALRAGVPRSVPAVTVMRNCGSGMEAMLAAEHRLRAGDGDLFLVGGTESMSNFPLIMGRELTAFFARMQKSRSLWQRLRLLGGFRPRWLRPRVALVEGLTDPVTGMIMGNTAERLARLFAIDRRSMDEFALRSHQRAAAARESGRLAREIAPVALPSGAVVSQDDGIRAEQTIEALARLRPVFDRENGDVTVGNACQVTDGAVALLCASEARARGMGLTPLAVVRGHARAGLDPATMGLGPVHATPVALEQAGIELDQVDAIEINEAFAAQVLGCLRAFEDEDYCREMGLPGPVGAIDEDRLNPNGGAIAIGHPIAATGARIALTVAHELRVRGKRYGLAALCIGGGQGQAMVLEAT
ncbi:MAG: acetyl-CoA C-acetyltransferase [Planctomycetota bacterium]